MAVHQPGSAFPPGKIFAWQWLEGHQYAVCIQAPGFSVQLFKNFLMAQVQAIKIANSEYAILMRRPAILQATYDLYACTG